jgi:hypothetical protein
MGMQLGKRDAGIMRMLRTACLSAEKWEETLDMVVRNALAAERVNWKLLAGSV